MKTQIQYEIYVLLLELWVYSSVVYDQDYGCVKRWEGKNIAKVGERKKERVKRMGTKWGDGQEKENGGEGGDKEGRWKATRESEEREWEGRVEGRQT